MTSWVVLINPSAGKRSVSPARVSEALARHHVDASVEMVGGIDQMKEAVLDVARSGFGVAVVGGDGTANLAANVLLSSGLVAVPPLAILPSGTGCDLLRTFGISQVLEEAAAHLATPSTYRIDAGALIGEWGTRYFLNVAQAGAGAAAAIPSRFLPRRVGAARYPIAFAMRLPGFPACEIELEGGSGFRGRALAVIFANAQFFAGGWNVAPKAMLGDGELDVQVIDALKRQAPMLVPKVIKGVHLNHRNVRRQSLAAFGLKTGVPWPIEADGDIVGMTPVEVKVVPNAIEMKI